MKKAIIALLAIMLVIIVVFTSFGFAYSKNDFVSVMAKTENSIGDFSSKTLETYNSVKTVFNKLSEILHFSEIPDVLDSFHEWTNKTFNSVSNHLSFFNKYPLNPFSPTWWKRYNYFYGIQDSNLIKNADNSYNWDIFDKLFLGFENGVLPDEFKYIESNYTSYKNKCYRDMLLSDNYSLLFISYTSTVVRDYQSAYKKMCDSKVPFICVKIPAVASLVFDSTDYFDLYDEDKFITDMLTEYEYPVFASFKIDIPDLGLTEAKPQFVRFAEISDVGSFTVNNTACRFRYDFSPMLSTRPTWWTGQQYDLGNNNDFSTSLLGISLGFYSERNICYFEAGQLYLDYIEQNNLGGFAIPDFGYAVPTANIFNTTFLAYDEKGVVASMLN